MGMDQPKCQGRFTLARKPRISHAMSIHCYFLEVQTIWIAFVLSVDPIILSDL